MSTTTPITHDEAREIAKRYVNLQFDKNGDKPRASIPADRERDDDIRLYAYIQQNEALQSQLNECREALAAERAMSKRLASILDYVWERTFINKVGEYQFKEGFDIQPIIDVLSNYQDHKAARAQQLTKGGK